MEKPHQVLLVEDDPLIAKTLKMSLPYKGFAVTSCGSLKEGMAAFCSQSFDVVLLDVNLPDGSGLDLCREMRKKNSTVAILMLTAQTDEVSAVNGLEWGADDYVRKPYGVHELAARMTRLLDRGKKASSALQYGSVRIDSDKRIAWAGDVQLSLGKREFEILFLLIRKAGDAVTRVEILDTFGEDAELYDRTVDSHLSHLRKKLKDAGSIDVQIVPIYGIGYRMEKK